MQSVLGGDFSTGEVGKFNPALTANPNKVMEIDSCSTKPKSAP
jgi:hypothetical protein